MGKRRTYSNPEPHGLKKRLERKGKKKLRGKKENARK
jgi:hypothetical protein